MEYSGNNPQSKRLVDDYNKISDPYFRDGKLKGDYIQKEFLKAMDNMSFRKFASLYRKHVNPYFSRANNEKSVGGNVTKGFTFEELATYIIGDAAPSSFEEASFRDFAKAAGIEVPKFKEPTKSEAKSLEAEVKPTEVEGVKPTEVEGVKAEEVAPPKSRRRTKKEEPKAETEKEIVSLPENEKELDKFLLEMQEKGIIKVEPC